MLTNIALRKAAGLSVAVAALAFGLMLLATPQGVAGQGRPGVQGGQETHPLSTGLPKPEVWQANRFSTLPDRPDPQMFSNPQACLGQPLSLFDGPLSPSSIGPQAPALQWGGRRQFLDAMSWFGYNNGEVAWWSYANPNLNPALGPCGALQLMLIP